MSTPIPIPQYHHCPDPNTPVSLIFEGDNLPILQHLISTHRSGIDAIFADPPYNSGTTEAYENALDDETWIANLTQRLELSRELLTPDGSICITIGDDQLGNTLVTADRIFGRRNRIADIVVVHNETGHAGPPVRNTHEHYVLYARDARKATFCGETVTDAELHARFPHQDETGPFTWQTLVRHGADARPEDRRSMCYPVHIDPTSGRMDTSEFPGSTTIQPVDGKGELRRWYCSKNTFDQWAEQGKLRIRPVIRAHEHTHTIDMKVRPRPRAGHQHLQRPPDVWIGTEFHAATYGKKLLDRMIGPNPFSYPKSVHAVQRVLQLMVGHKPEATVLDPYAGSGTTAHALLMLNADHDFPGRRTFIMATNNDVATKGSMSMPICEEICLPRVRAAIDGYVTHTGRRYRRTPGLPGAFLYLRMTPDLT